MTAAQCDQALNVGKEAARCALAKAAGATHPRPRPLPICPFYLPPKGILFGLVGGPDPPYLLFPLPSMAVFS